LKNKTIEKTINKKTFIKKTKKIRLKSYRKNPMRMKSKKQIIANKKNYN
jgi:hypothetical protein